MAAGCKKADRQRKSPGNLRYKAENRHAINKAKHIKRAAKQAKRKAEDPPKKPRGTTRFLRRKPKQLAYAAQHELREAA